MPQVPVIAAPTLIYAAPAGRGSFTVLLRNTDAANAVALGPSDVTFANGYPLAASTNLVPILVGPGARIYGICNTGLTALVTVFAVLAERED